MKKKKTKNILLPELLDVGMQVCEYSVKEPKKCITWTIQTVTKDKKGNTVYNLIRLGKLSEYPVPLSHDGLLGLITRGELWIKWNGLSALRHILKETEKPRTKNLK